MAIYPRVIYIITHNVTKRSYIGSSGRFNVRIKRHLEALRSGRHSVEDMQKDFDIYGENFTIKVIGEMNSIVESIKEYDAMREYRTYIRGLGYNYKDNHLKIEKGGDDVLYPNLRAELARKGIKLEELAHSLNITLGTLSQKLNGKYPVMLNEAKQIKKVIGTDLPLETLFSKEPI